MAMIFPGMDPYLENPAVFPGIHGPMCIYLRDLLAPQIRPRYIASVGERVYVEGGRQRPIIPDVWVRRSPSSSTGTAAVIEPDTPVVVEIPDLEITEPFIEILDREADLRIVTVIELVSPSNKFPGIGRESYIAKQTEIRHSDTNLVEIDLLRRGNHVVSVREDAARGKYDFDYLVCVNRAGGLRTVFELYPRTVREPLPKIAIPLAGDDADVTLDIGAALEQAWLAGDYLARIDYRQPCTPPLSPENQAWADERIAAYFNAAD